MSARVFTAGFLFCGLGAGALGFLRAQVQMGADSARFESLGGVDLDPDSCRDFETLTGSPALEADIADLANHPEKLRAFWGPRRPDAVFSSPPCKGMSRLLGKERAKSEKYQALNSLVLKGIVAACDAYPDDPPPLVVIENVPGIATRGAAFLNKVRSLLLQLGYRLHESTHDCGEIGGLAQHRRRFLLVARRERSVSAFMHKPPLQRVRGCGEVLGELPVPGGAEGGPHHRLPRISWLNWVRLSLIPAGGDWRDLPTREGLALKLTTEKAAAFAGSPGLFGVDDWAQPAPTVTGSTAVSSSNTPGAVADPRIRAGTWQSAGALGVQDWEEPARPVIGSITVSSNNAFGAVADPRIPQDLLTPLAEGQPRREIFARDPVLDWAEPSPTVTGPSGNAAPNVADPRLAESPARHAAKFRVEDWEKPVHVVTGSRQPGSGGPAVADERVPLNCSPRSGAYGVMGWQEAASTVIGAASIDNARTAVADPRRAPEVVPVIVAADGAWHRPLTDLDLCVLQGIPAVVAGKPLVLSRGGGQTSVRERIGNAVPVGAAVAIAASMLRSLLASSLGTWGLSAEGIWVSGRGPWATRRSDSQREAVQ